MIEANKHRNVGDIAVQKGIRSALFGIAANCILVIIKACAGVFGNSYALIADAIESGSDVLTSLAIIVGLKLSRKPADESHPYGHGKFEPMAGALVALALLAAAIIIAIESFHEIITPHHAPAAFTLIVLFLAILIKETLFRFVLNVGTEVESIAVKTDAWHHRSDAITSAAAFIGISIALIGGEGYESADDFAALIASVIISINAIKILKPALFELLDSAPDRSYAQNIRKIALAVPGVIGTHKCYVRKLGFDYFVDLDVLCDPNAPIREGHEIAHNVGEALHQAIPSIKKVLVHIEPADDYGRRSRDSLGE